MLFPATGIPCFIAFHRCSVFYKLKARLSISKKDYDSFYYDTCFIAVVWSWTHNVSEVCLYFHCLLGWGTVVPRRPSFKNTYDALSRSCSLTLGPSICLFLDHQIWPLTLMEDCSFFIPLERAAMLPMFCLPVLTNVLIPDDPSELFNSYFFVRCVNEHREPVLTQRLFFQ